MKNEMTVIAVGQEIAMMGATVTGGAMRATIPGITLPFIQDTSMPTHPIRRSSYARRRSTGIITLATNRTTHSFSVCIGLGGG